MAPPAAGSSSTRRRSIAHDLVELDVAVPRRTGRRSRCGLGDRRSADPGGRTAATTRLADAPGARRRGRRVLPPAPPRAGAVRPPDQRPDRRRDGRPAPDRRDPCRRPGRPAGARRRGACWPRPRPLARPTRRRPGRSTSCAADRRRLLARVRPRTRLRPRGRLGWTAARDVEAVDHPVIATDRRLDNGLVEVVVGDDGTFRLTGAARARRGRPDRRRRRGRRQLQLRAAGRATCSSTARTTVEVGVQAAGPLRGELAITRRYDWPRGLTATPGVGRDDGPRPTVTTTSSCAPTSRSCASG